MLKLCIIGTGGFSLEVFDILMDIYPQINKNIEEEVFFVDDSNKSSKHLGLKIVKEKDVDFINTEIIIAVGDSTIRKKIVDKLPKTTKYARIIHPSSFISPSSILGRNIIISHNCVVSSKVEIGDHSHLNYHTCIGHETKIKDFFTSAPGVKISGNCNIGNNVYFGTNSSIIQGKIIVDDVKVGIGSVVLNNIKNPGTYLFNPSKKIF